jgi:transcriptional regulator with XRE-family HTH domain
MNERIKELRRCLGLTQQALSDKLNLKRNTIATYEIGRAIPSDRVIADICFRFNVNEDWLRYGKGAMFVAVSLNEEIATFAGNLMKEEDNFKKRFINALSKLDVEDWELLERIAAAAVQRDK